MDIQINGIYTLEDGREIVCIEKGVRYWVACELKKLEEAKVLVDYSTAKIYEIGKEEQGYLVEEVREILD